MTSRAAVASYFQNTHEYHRVAPHLYELSELRAANVRDQIVRATHLTRALCNAGLIDKDRPMLVLGGGAAGFSCAVTALEYSHASVWLLEREATLFSVQMNVETRVICPVEFDWPHANWSGGALPDDTGCDYPLRFERSPADLIAFDWLQQATRYQAVFAERFRVFTNMDVRSLEFDGQESGVRVPKLDQLSSAPILFGAVVSCIGFGSEIVADKTGRWSYAGVKFWANDRLKFERLNIKNAPTVGVLISGAGDGAMQDVQRALTRKFGRDLAEALGSARIDSPTFSVSLQAMANQCSSIDGQLWGSTEWTEHHGQSVDDLKLWHQEYEALVNHYWSQTPDEELDWQYLNVIRSDVRDASVKLTWLLRQGYFTVCYPLNRVLVLWVLRLYARGIGRKLSTNGQTENAALDDEAILMVGFEIAKVSSGKKAHVCGTRVACDGQEHLVLVRDLSKPADTPRILGSFHEIVIRHGVVPDPLFAHSSRRIHLRSQDIAQGLGVNN